LLVPYYACQQEVEKKKEKEKEKKKVLKN